MRLENVELRYEGLGDVGVSALRGVSLGLRSGEKLGVIGTNGAGKSTLLRVMAGVLEPDTGIFDPEGESAALLSLNAGFDADLSGVDNVVMHGLLMGLDHGAATARVEMVREMSELGDAMERRMSTYSSGMRARLCFSTAVTMEPDVLLVDEMLSVGDIAFREKSLALMRERFTGDRGVVFVSHNIPMVRQFCDSVAWMHEGTVRRLGPADEVIDAYRLEFQP